MSYGEDFHAVGSGANFPVNSVENYISGNMSSTHINTQVNYKSSATRNSLKLIKNNSTLKSTISPFFTTEKIFWKTFSKGIQEDPIKAGARGTKDLTEKILR